MKRSIETKGRVLATVRRDLPLALILPPLTVGQLLPVAPYPFAVLLASAIILLVLLPPSLRYLTLFLVAGFFSAYEPALPFDPKDEHPYVAKVIGEIRYRKTGGIELPMLLTARYAPFEKLLYPTPVLCKGVHLPWRNSLHAEEGSLFIIRGKFKPVKDELISYDASLKRKGFQGTCKIVHLSRPSSVPQGWVEKLRRTIESKVEAIGSDEEVKGLFLAMTLGTKDLLSQETENAFKVTGLSHLLVLSGFQITLVFYSIKIVFRKVATIFPNLVLYLPIPFIVTSLATLFAFILSLVAGFEGASARAAFALLTSSLVNNLGRQSSFLNSLFVSYLCLCIGWPGCVLDPGVDLTYAALLGIYLGTDVERAPLQSLIYINFLCFLCTSAITAAWFGTISVVSVVLNPLVASAASLLSCNAGGIALIALCSGADPKGYLLWIVLHAIEFLRRFVLWCSATLPSTTVTVEGGWKVVMIGILLAYPILCGYRRFMRYERGVLKR